MKRRTILLAALLSIAVLIGLAWLIFSTHEPPEPVYAGKRLSEWLAEIDDAGAEQALQHIGTNAIPTLLRMLRAHDSEIKLKLIGLAQKQHLIKINHVDAWILNWQAGFAFRYMGTEASNAVPGLIQIYEEAISESSQKATAEALLDLGPAAKAAVPALLRTIANTNANAYVRADAVTALGPIHANPELAVPALITCLKDSKLNVREHAALALVAFEKDARAAVPALLELLKDPDYDLRSMAGQSLKQIDPEAAAKAGIK